MDFSQANPNPVIDAVLFEKLKVIGLYVTAALAVWYFVKRERL